jgi:uroporphyrinogen-III synthase
MIFTSETAVEAARRIVADGAVLPTRAFCVGRQTALAAASAGFDPISADGNAEALIALVTAQSPRGPLLHMHGRDTRGTVGESLQSAGIETLSLEVYAQDLQPLSDEAAALLRHPTPVIAPRTAQALARECNRIGIKAAITIIAISPAAATAFGAGDITIAAHPDAQSMIAAIMSRMNTKAKP